MFQLYAGVDILEGKVARLIRGRVEDAVFYPGSPTEYVRRWLDDGADWVHVVDLDAALERGDNTALLRQVAEAALGRVQAGGGVRSVAKALDLVDAGVSRIVISSLYFSRREDALMLLGSLGAEKLCVALDFDEVGMVVTRGWRERTRLRLQDAVEQVLSDGFRHVLATDVAADGTLAGTNLTVLATVDEELRHHMVVGGGVSSVRDLLLLRDSGFAGAVVGKALYENRLSLREAVDTLKHRQTGR
ncbi:MAG: 1-(5-phosphoribosyl)-5-[(5-phosphoribosylamino)methylideneamino] imidazole-4-carboxamide isomerase [Candidatus Caldarchaeum sp.]